MPTTTQSPPRQELQLKVKGMHCASCAAVVQQAIESRPGVHEASVSVTDGLATVTGDDLETEALVRAVRERGYDAEALAEALAPSELRSEIELRQATAARVWGRRAVIGLGVWAPMAATHWTAEAMGWSAPWLPWLMLIGASVVLVGAGAGFYRSAWSAARHRTTNMDTLIAMGATTAFVYSLVVFIMQRVGVEITQPLYFGESAALLGIISFGHWLEARASARAGSGVRELLELQPDQAEVLDRHGGLVTIASAQVQPGDRMLIRPGARVPVDGVVVEGASDIDESVVSGESTPVRKAEGDGVVAGSVNTTGRLVVEATVDGHHTTVARIAEMVQRAQTSKANIQRLADRVCAVFVPAVLTIAAVTFAAWWLLGDLATGVIATVTVLIISCPCALGLATPMAVMVGAGAASRRGILIKSALALEQTGRAHLVVLDKTGTLTANKPAVIAIEPAAGATDEAALLRLAAAVEMPSEHPIARAIVAEARRRGLDLPAVSGFEAVPGHGVRGRVDGRRVEIRRADQATCEVLVDGEPAGTITIADRLRDDAREAVQRLRAMGLELVMLSGDRRTVAESVGRELGLEPDEIHAEATPEAKFEFVRTLPAGSVMVGDGINDAAALAEADIGIAIASGTNIAIESADVVIPGDRVMAVAETIHIARRTLATIKQNLFFAFIYNVVAIPVAALGLLGPMGPLVAAAAMGLSDITVIGNALRLRAGLKRF